MENMELKEHLLNGHHDFSVPSKKLENLFKLEHITSGTSLRKFRDKWQSVSQLAHRLHSDIKTGIEASDGDLSRREKVYGSNQPEARKAVSYFQFVKDECEEITLIILTICAIVSLSLGIYEDPEEGWMEGTAIMACVIAIILIASINNWANAREFEELYRIANEKFVTVVRKGEKTVISVDKLLVGDILQLQTGDIAAVDGIVIRAAGLATDESSITGESTTIKKGWEEGASPFILSGSKISQGTGDMLVACVGKNSSTGKSQASLGSHKRKKTPLESKLKKVAMQIGFVGLLVSTLTLLVLWGYIIYDIINIGWHNDYIARFINNLIVAITILDIAVPEGLPLAVTLSLAFAVSSMRKENNLVRHLKSCEIMGGATSICSDKTGTLTTNIMTVVKMWALEQSWDESEFSPRNFQESFLNILCNSVIQNSTAEVKIVKNGNTESANFIGNRSECAMLQMSDKFGYDYRTLRDPDTIFLQLPFSSLSKSMSTIIADGDDYLIYVKGASEIIVEKCSHYINADGHATSIQSYYSNVQQVISDYAENSLRTIALAYKRVPKADVQLKDEEGNPIYSNVVNDLTLVAIVGIADPIRKEVPEAVRLCHKAGIAVRMLTGDNLKTAISIAKDCGILPSDYTKGENDYTVMEGKEFREAVGGTVRESSGESIAEIAHPEVFNIIAGQLRVLARSSPEDKYILVSGLKNLNEVVAVTGDGTNDAPALKMSDVGFAMHITGTQIAKDASDIVLLDDNFASIVTSVKWGRNIYDGIRKFIQFQLINNVVALIMAFIGSALYKVSPFSAVQFLWINLIMDTFAALKLATEPPNDELLNRPPYSRNESILNIDLYKNITGQVIYELFWLIFILFYGHIVFELDSPFNPEFAAKYPTFTLDELILQPNEHFTFLFNTFIFMILCCEINCRKIRSSELNVFKNFFNNWIFISIFTACIVIQVLMIYFGG
jgi:Ca2+ transporting ATPase